MDVSPTRQGSTHSDQYFGNTELDILVTYPFSLLLQMPGTYLRSVLWFTFPGFAADIDTAACLLAHPGTPLRARFL